MEPKDDKAMWVIFLIALVIMPAIMGHWDILAGGLAALAVMWLSAHDKWGWLLNKINFNDKGKDE